MNRLDVDDADESDVDTTGIEAGDGQFAMEAHLRDALALSMGLIEPGLALVGKEVEAGNGRRIDLLGLATDGSYVVVELKVSRGYDRVVGQLLRYRNWVSKHMADGRPVRGVIVAREISEDLGLASTGAPINVTGGEMTILKQNQLWTKLGLLERKQRHRGLETIVED